MNQNERWTKLAEKGKTRVNGEICCVRYCNTGFDYDDCAPGAMHPPHWQVFYLGEPERIGLLCPTHQQQFPTADDAENHLDAFDLEKMIDRPEDA